MDAGATVFAADIAEEDLADTADLFGDNVLPVAMDVTDPEAMEKCVSDIVSEHQRVDVLINNAGITVQGTRTNELSKSDWDRVLDINLTSSFNFYRAVLP